MYTYEYDFSDVLLSGVLQFFFIINVGDLKDHSKKDLSTATKRSTPAETYIKSS